jgi:arabinofuranosyltransferase
VIVERILFKELPVRQRTRLLILSLVTLAILAAGLAVFHYIPDDTFITLRYARNVLRGEGFVFNPGERVEGYTNFLWLLIVVFAGKLGFPLVAAARTLSLVFSLGTLALVARAARRDDAPDGASPGWREAIGTFLPSAMLAASPPFLVWSVSGSEIPLFTFLLFAGFMLLRAGNRPGAALVVFGLLGLVRPEGTLFFSIAFIFLLARSHRRKTIAALGLGIAAVFYGPYLAWKWSYYHALLPNTFYAKTGPAGLMLANGTRYVSGFALSYGYLFAAGVLLLRAAGRAFDSYSLPLLFTAAAGLEVLFLGGDWMPHYRMLLPILPFVMLTVSRGVMAIAAREARAAALALALVLLAAAPGAVGYDSFTLERLTVDAFSDIGRRLRDVLPPGTAIGCGSTGAIGYYTDMPIVDILGLTERFIARHGVVVGTQPGHLKTDGEYVIEKRPDLLLLGNVQFHRGTRGRDRMRLKIQEEEIAKQPEFERNYDFVNIPLGRGFYLSCFKLKSYFLPVETEGAAPSVLDPLR